MRFLVLFICALTYIEVWSQDLNQALRAINSPYDEQNPVLSPDGTTLYFTIGNHPENTGSKKDPGDIWFATRQGAGWSSPVHGGPHLNDRTYNAVAGFSPDGTQMFLHGHYGVAGTPARSQGISVSRNKGSGWSRPENITIPYFLNKSGIISGSLSADNSVFVFSAESYGTYGVEDIYVSTLENGKWAEPRNLGNTINTQFQELSPWLSNDMRTLYFSSNGRKGMGSFDVYSSTRLDEGWTNWSIPENLGTRVNTEGRELFYRKYESPGFAIFTTTTSSDGYGDVRLDTPDNPFPVNDSLMTVAAPPPMDQVASTRAAAQPAPTNIAPVSEEVNLRGKITNAKTGEPIAAKVSFEAPGIDLSATADQNGYVVSVPAAQYSIRIEANGFISALEKLDINALDMRDLEMNFKLQPVEVGMTVNLKNVLFVQAKTDILPESYPELDLVVSFMKDNPTVRIELMGHTDGRGVHADNVRLSQQRVNKVKEYLVSKGIEGKRISGRGFGGSKPIASNDTEESRRMNRRVEFVIKRF